MNESVCAYAVSALRFESVQISPFIKHDRAARIRLPSVRPSIYSSVRSLARSLARSLPTPLDSRGATMQTAAVASDRHHRHHRHHRRRVPSSFRHFRRYARASCNRPAYRPKFAVRRTASSAMLSALTSVSALYLETLMNWS